MNRRELLAGLGIVSLVPTGVTAEADVDSNSRLIIFNTSPETCAESLKNFNLELREYLDKNGLGNVKFIVTHGFDHIEVV